MPKRTEIPEIRIALFGAGAAGKSTLLASYFGNQQRNSFEETHGYRLQAENISVGNELLARYYRMEQGEFPLGTVTFGEYGFGLKIKGLAEPCLRIVWYDYPGGWWEREPEDESEVDARREALSKLLTSHVGVLLVDGDKYQALGLPYLRHLLDHFHNEVRRISDQLAGLGTPFDSDSLPRQWIIAISKADLLPPPTTAEVVCKEIVAGAHDQLRGVANEVQSTSFGDQFLLLSSARGEGAHVLDAHESVGLELVAPVALLSVLTEIAVKADRGRVHGVLSEILKRLGALGALIDRMDDFLPRRYQVLTAILQALELQRGLDRGSEYFRERQAAAAQRGQALQALAATLRAELASEAAQRAYYRNQG